MSNRVDTFDEMFEKEIQQMKDYLLNSGLNMISFTNTDGWSFRLSIPRHKWQKLKLQLVKINK